MPPIAFRCARCGHCCRASIPLGLDEALDYDDRFLLALTIAVETWNIDDFAKNRPAFQVSHDDLLTTLAFRKDKLARPESRDVVFSVGKLKASGQRLATFVSVGAAGLGSWTDGGARCPGLGPDNACTLYENRPLGCRVFPLDPLYPERLQDAPLAGLAGRIACGFGPDAPPFWQDGRVLDADLAELLTRRQDALARDSLFLPFYGENAGLFPDLPRLSQVMTELFRGARMDLPFVAALAHLVAAGRVEPDRARLTLARQRVLALAEVQAALTARDKARRGRTTVLRNTLALMDHLEPGLDELARQGLQARTDGQAPQAPPTPD